MLAVDHAKLFGTFEWEYKKAGRTEDPDLLWPIDVPLAVIAPSGAGKTLALTEYLESRRVGYYFSFKNVSFDLALKLFVQKYTDVFGNCSTWTDFFSRLDDKLGFRYYASIVFDDVDFERIEPKFIRNLKLFLRRHKTRNVFVILSGRRFKIGGTDYFACMLPTFTTGNISNSFPEYGVLDRIRLMAITEGYPGLLSMIDRKKSFRENVAEIFREDSKFFRPAENRFKESFRIPESYSSLMYAMASGVHRLTELAEYSGYAPNKCDKYLHAMIDAGLVFSGDVKSEDGRTKKGYFLKSSYMTLWAKFCMNNSCRMDHEKFCEEILSYIDDSFLPGFFRRMCGIWIIERQFRLHHKYLRFKDESNYNFTVGDVTFDYVQRDDDRMLFVKIWDDLEQTRGPEDWEKIMEAVASVNKFYNSEIVLCSLRRFRETMWKYPRDFRNLHLMEARNMITGDETWDLREQDPDTFFKTWSELVIM